MLRRKFTVAFLLYALFLPGFALAQTVSPARPFTVPADVINRIKDEGSNRSQVMRTLRYITDNIGPRLTNSPAQRRASAWTRDKLTEWGLQNARLDAWGPFGRGWQIRNYTASVVAPDNYPFHSYPKAWSPGTNGAITADVIYVDAQNEADLAKYRGKLKGAIVLTGAPRDVTPGFDPTATRRDEKNLLDLAHAHDESAFPRPAPTPNAQFAAAQRLNQLKNQLYYEEGAALLVDPSQGVDAGTIRVMGAALPPQAGNGNPFAAGAPRSWDKTPPRIIPQIVAAIEQYNRLVRLLQQGEKIRMTVNLDVQFTEDDLMGYNTLADIPGSDLRDETVLIGAHLDSWHSATGSTDNASGVAVVMEAARILQSLGLKPRRTVSVALWTGEEQGLFGSRAYVEKYLATIEGNPTAAFGGGGERKIVKKPGYDKFSAYYNLDNGTGRIRGVYMQGNEALRPLFGTWLYPFREMGATTLTYQSTGGTDHVPFDAIGLPGFQFIQDPIEYFTRTWHTTQDVSDRVLEEDLKQSAIIMATFAYQSAMMDEKLPRKTMR